MASAMTASVMGTHGRICWSAPRMAPPGGTGSPPIRLEPNDVWAPHRTPIRSQRAQTPRTIRAFIGRYAKSDQNPIVCVYFRMNVRANEVGDLTSDGSRI